MGWSDTEVPSKEETYIRCLREIADVLKFFSEIRAYSYVDRVANAVSPLPAETALLEALRHLRSLYSTAKKDPERNRFYTMIDDVKKYLPRIPSSECVEKAIELIRRDDNARRLLAALSLSY